MDVHLVDGTYELFRHFFAVPPGVDAEGREVGAVRGVLASILGLIEGGATHVGVATDHVIESFRNRLYSGYKTSEGVPAALLSQFPILEEALQSMGVAVWSMIEFEADDALASAAAKAARDQRVRQVIVCTPDKDLAQCVEGSRVVQLDRRLRLLRDEAAVVAKWGVGPQSIPDYLALVGDASDGYPGLAGWGAKAASSVLSRYPHLEDIPRNRLEWPASIRGAQRLAQALWEGWEDAVLFRRLATLRRDLAIFETVEELEWRGPAPEFEGYSERMQAPWLFARAMSLWRRKGKAPAVSPAK
jgi:5'-3' exonuclease